MAQTPTIPDIEKGVERRRRRWLLHAVVGVVVLAVFVAAGLYLTGASFRDRVRRAVVAQLEDATGGRVDIQSFRWNVSRLDAEIDGLTIHGREAPDEAPYLHVDHLSLRAKVLALLERRIGLRYVGVTRPVLHLIVYPDGSTNQPAPKAHGSDRDSVQSVFDLAMQRADVSDGILLLNDRKLPFTVHASDFAAALTMPHRGAREYSLHVSATAVELLQPNAPPVAAGLQLEAAVYPNHAVIKSLRLNSGRSSLEAHGSVSDLKNPQTGLDFKARVDAIDAARIENFPEVRGGVIDIQGKFGSHAEDYGATGELAFRDLRYKDETLDLGPVNGSSSFTLGPTSIHLTRVDARLWNGRATGEMQLSDYRHWGGKGAANLQLSGIPLSAVMRASSYTRRSSTTLDSAISGNVMVQWQGALSQSDAKLDLALSQPGSPVGGAHAVAGVLQGTYSGRAHTLNVAALELHTSATQLDASGKLGVRTAPSARLGFTLVTRNPADLAPLLELARIQLPPLQLHGAVNVDGSMNGALESPHVRGHLSADNFEVENPADIWRNATQSKLPAVHVDTVAADLDYTRTTLKVANGAVHRGPMLGAVTGSLQLGRFERKQFVAFPVREMPISAHVALRNASLSDLQQLAGIAALPATGTLRSDMQFSGSAAHLNASGDGEIASGSIYGEPFRDARAHVDLQSDNVRLSRVSVAQDGGTIAGDGTYNLVSRKFQANLRGDGFELSHFNALQPARSKVSGRMSFTLQGSGTPEAPAINAHAQIANARIDTEPLGNVALDGVTQGDTLHVAGSTSNRIANLQLTGDVHLRGDFPATLHAKLNDFDIDPLLKLYAGGRVTGHSRTVGTVDAAGPLRYPRQMTAEGDIETVRISVENFELNNRSPIRFDLRNETVHVQQFELVGEDTDFSLGGTVALGRDQRIDGAINGAVNVKLLRSFNPHLTASGIANVRAVAQGTIARPSLTGEITLRNVNVATLDLPNGLSNMNGRLVFSQDRLLVQQVTGQTGGGTVNLGGFVGVRSGLYFDITAAGRDIRIRQQGISASADSDLRLSGTLKASTLSGDVVLNRFTVGTNFDFANLLLRSKQGSSADDPQSIANHIRLNIRVTSAPQLAVETSLARLSGDVDLNLRGTALNPVILGRVNVAEGDIQFQGTKYHIDRADVTFTNPARIEPVLNVEASTTVRSYDITLGFHGPMDHLQTNYRSEPPLPTADIISLLAFQRTTEEAANSQQQTTFTESAQNAVLGEALNAAVSSRIQKLFGISKVKIDPQGGGLENNKPSITVEQQVHQNLTVTFVTYPTQSNQQLIQVEYNINKNVSIVGVRDQYGVLGIDVRLRQRKR